MVRFSLLVLIGASALFLLAAGAQMKAAFTLSCREDPLKNFTATVELWDYGYIFDHKLLTRIENVPVDGKTECTIEGDAHNNFYEIDAYFLKIIHNCHTTCTKNASSYYPINRSHYEWRKMNKEGRGEGWRFTSIKERLLDLSYGHNFKSLVDDCEE